MSGLNGMEKVQLTDENELRRLRLSKRIKTFDEYVIEEMNLNVITDERSTFEERIVALLELFGID